MNCFLELPKFCTAFAQGDVVQISQQAQHFLCRVLRSAFVVVARFGRFVSLREPLLSKEEIVQFPGFTAQKVALASSARVIVQDFSDITLYEKLLLHCPVADGCTLGCGLRAVRVACDGGQNSAVVLQSFERGAVRLKTAQVASCMEERLALVLERLERTNLLLTGPSGCGKTTLLIQAAASLQIPYKVVKDFSILQTLQSFDGLLIFRALDLAAPQRSDFSTKEQNDNCTLLLRFLNSYRGRAAATCEDSGQVDLALRRPGRFGAELVCVPAEEHERQRFFARVLPPAGANRAAALTQNYTWAELRAVSDAAVQSLQRRRAGNAGNETGADNANNTVDAGDVVNAIDAVDAVDAALRAVQHAPNWLEVFQVQDLPCEGFEGQIQRITQNFDLYVRSREKCKKLGIAPENVLIFGPPQAGKTTLLHAVLQRISTHFAIFALKAHQILSMYVGESEINVRKLFRLARQQAPSLIVIESVDDLFGSREASSSSTRLITCLLAEIDGAGASQDVFIIATASSKIDDALCRFGRLGLRVDVDWQGDKRKSGETNWDSAGANQPGQFGKKWDFDGPGKRGAEDVEQAPV